MEPTAEGVPIIYMLVGRRYRVRYVEILERMLRRHITEPFTLHCIVDRPRRLPPTVRTIDEDHVVSYRNARKLARTDPDAAHAMLERGIVVKFFGKTKMHQLLNPVYRWLKLREHASDRSFWVRELRERWS